MTEEESTWGEICLIQDSSLKIWRMYLSWFTWFFGANLIALSWILASETVDKMLVDVLAVLMGFSILLGIIAGLRMRIYYVSIRRRAEELRTIINKNYPDVDVVFCHIITCYAIWLIPTALASVFAAWVFVGFQFGQK